ncbi:hypothetical protein [Ferrimonas balearica]|uniref:hypothetical protein n=1 Tax=Ferrimonas balearica TaxID=44012 RepID=UPI001C990D38|nr:hypothetical protein [Ferrimonas balearica]MBY5992423.1 hypothetical protein [Ferrimonas balearica]
MQKLLIGLSVLALAGCGGSSSSDPAPNPDTPTFTAAQSGIYLGTVSGPQELVGLALLSPDGDIRSLSSDPYDGYTVAFGEFDAEGKNGSYSAEGRVFGCDINSCLWENTSLSGQLQNGLFSGTQRFADSSAEYSIEMQRDPDSNLEFDLSALGGRWSDGYTELELASDGSFSGLDLDGCVMTGQITPHDGVNLLSLTFSLSQCEFDGQFEGLGFMFVDGDGHNIWALTSSELYVFPFIVWDGKATSGQAPRFELNLRTPTGDGLKGLQGMGKQRR